MPTVAAVQDPAEKRGVRAGNRARVRLGGLPDPAAPAGAFSAHRQ